MITLLISVSCTLSIMAQEAPPTETPQKNDAVGDLNGDGTIDGQDLATFLANWEPCP